MSVLRGRKRGKAGDGGASIRSALYLVTAGFIGILLSTLTLLVRLGPHYKGFALSLYILSWVLIASPAILFLFRRRGQRRFRDVAVGSGILLLLLIAGYAFLILFPGGPSALSAETATLQATMESDAGELLVILHGLDRHWAMLRDDRLLTLTMENATPEETTALKDSFGRLLDDLVQLEDIVDRYRHFYRIDGRSEERLKDEAFIIGYTAFVAKYRLLFRLTREVGTNGYVETLLNEEIPDFGPDVYHRLKYRLNEGETLLRLTMGKAYLSRIAVEETDWWARSLAEYTDEAYTEVAKDLDHSFWLTLDSVTDALEKRTVTRWLPVQRSVAKRLATTSLIEHRHAITASQVTESVARLEPGDIMVERRDWLASNAGMPGFWTHSALYVGTLEELDAYFGDILGPETTVSGLLSERYPDIHAAKQSPGADGFPLRTIEGKAQGVIMLSLEESVAADHWAVLRPRLSKERKLEALLFAFANHGKPYDYEFDFSTEDAYVCSELVYKAYRPRQEGEGLLFGLRSVARRPLLSPHDLVRAFDEEYGTERQQSDFVLFLDGQKEGTATWRDVEAFRASWRRPKYDFLS